MPKKLASSSSSSSPSSGLLEEEQEQTLGVYREETLTTSRRRRLLLSRLLPHLSPVLFLPLLLLLSLDPSASSSISTPISALQSASDTAALGDVLFAGSGTFTGACGTGGASSFCARTALTINCVDTAAKCLVDGQKARRGGDLYYVSGPVTIEGFTFSNGFVAGVSLIVSRERRDVVGRNSN